MQAIFDWIHPNGRITGLPNGLVESPSGARPAKIPAARMGRTIKKLAADDAHSLYVTADGTLWAMGRNNFGQLIFTDTGATFLHPVLPIARNVICGRGVRGLAAR